MATQTPKNDNLHGEEEAKPRFPIGSTPGDHDAPIVGGDDSGRPPAPGSSNHSESQFSPRSSRSEGGAPSRQEIGAQEAEAGSGASGVVESPEERLAGIQEQGRAGRGGLYRHEAESDSRFGKLTSLKGSLKKFTRRRVATIAITGLLGGGLVGGGAYLQGPAEAVQLAHILQRPMSGQQSTAGARINGMYRFYKTGNIGETRLNFLESRLNAVIERQWANKGITINKDPVTNQARTQVFDTSKNGSAYKGMADDASTARQIAKDYGLPENAVRRVGFNKFAFSYKNTDVATRATIHKTVDANVEKRTTAIAGRVVVTRFLNAPSLLHPMKKLRAALEQAGADRAAARKKERERKNQVSERTQAAVERAKSVRGKLEQTKGFKPGVATIAVQGTVCVIRDIAGEVAVINRENIVHPALKAEIDAKAHGSQTQSGDDFRMRQIGNFVQGLRDDEGKSVHTAAAMRALSNKKGGEDIDPAIKQGFSDKNTAREIKNTIDSFGGEVACNPIALTVGTVAGVALVVTGTGGAVMKSAQIAGGAAFVTALTTFMPKILSDEAPIKNLEGTYGGNVYAYAAREEAGIVGRTMGAVAREGSETQAVTAEAQQREAEEFKSRSFMARMFDIHDYRSMASQVMMEQSGSVTQNFASLFRGFGDNFASILMPKLSAATNSYDWGFPLYEFNKEDMENPNIQNPYENGEAVARILKDPSKESEYVDRAMQCFGVAIKKDENGKWDAVAEKDVNPASDEYSDANCGDDSLEWLRIRFFVLDVRTMEALACYELEDSDEHCAKVGANSVMPTTSENDTSGNADFKIRKLNPPLPGASSGGDIDPKGITLHWWGGEFGEGISGLTKIFRSNGLSVQVGITSEGETWQLTEKLTTKSSHATGGNSTTIGIEIEGGPEQFGKEGIEKYPEKFEAVVNTVQYLKDKYKIPIKKDKTCDNASGILQHSDFNHCPKAVHKDDIDDYYFNEVIKRLK